MRTLDYPLEPCLIFPSPRGCGESIEQQRPPFLFHQFEYAKHYLVRENLCESIPCVEELTSKDLLFSSSAEETLGDGAVTSIVLWPPGPCLFRVIRISAQPAFESRLEGEGTQAYRPLKKSCEAPSSLKIHRMVVCLFPLRFVGETSPWRSLGDFVVMVATPGSSPQTLFISMLAAFLAAPAGDVPWKLPPYTSNGTPLMMQEETANLRLLDILTCFQISGLISYMFSQCHRSCQERNKDIST